MAAAPAATASLPGAARFDVLIVGAGHAGAHLAMALRRLGFGGTVALVVQAGQTMGAAPVQIVSMVTALCLGIGLPGLLLSWRLKIPVILAWSTPGAP